MSVTHARATRMSASVTNQPNYAAYAAINPAITSFGDSGAPTNRATAPMAKASASWSFAKEDHAPEIALNRAIWKSIKGAGSPTPSPRHVRIIGSRPDDQSG
jgi:hypothetical protein